MTNDNCIGMELSDKMRAENVSEGALRKLRSILDLWGVDLAFHKDQGRLYIVPKGFKVIPNESVDPGVTIVTSRIATMEVKQFGNGHCIASEPKK